MKPVEADTPTPPLVFEVEGGSASVTFVDGAPLLIAKGGPRFSVRSRRRRPFKAKPYLHLDAGEPVAPRLGRGDVLKLTFGSVEHSWTYDPDGNLPRPVRWVMWLAREGAFAAAVTAGVAFCLHLSSMERDIDLGGGAAGSPIPGLLRSNLSSLYPSNSTEPSDYLREMVKARKEGRDVVQASKEWIETHKPSPRPGEDVK